ncbi:hypothetical protein [Natronorubrum sp. DTA7]|uniref:hypothetical protein n=1 Tax=Natronorubrum sp. DTA7 TaxID=3447016 RepID=UPI003F82CC3A
MSEEHTEPFDDSTPLPEELTAEVIDELAAAHHHLQRAEYLLYRYRGGILFPSESAAAYQLRECAESVQYAFECQYQTKQSVVTDHMVGLPDEPLEELIATRQAYRETEQGRGSH